MVAAFRPQKDYDTLLRSITHLPDNYRLQIVGGGDPHEGGRIKAYCSQLGLDNRVDFLGIRSDVPEIFEKSDIVVLSSHCEGLSLSSIEGMASGRPFVASDVDGLHEIVDGAGILFPEGDDQELARQIQYLCEHPAEYQKVAQQCQKRARQYDISVMADNYLSLYDELCSEHHS
jgi:glycosyltransferase involved in cell wall biosynthesis